MSRIAQEASDAYLNLISRNCAFMDCFKGLDKSPRIAPPPPGPLIF